MTTTTVHCRLDGWVDETRPSTVIDQSRQLKLDAAGATEKSAYLFFALPFHPGADVDVVEAIFSVSLKTAMSGTRDLEAKRINQSWTARSLTFNNAPTTTGVTSTVSVSGGVAGDTYEIDVTTQLSVVASGATPWYGLHLTVSAGGPYGIHSSEAFDSDLRPTLRVQWTEKPDAPVDLSPAGGRVVSKGKPNLGWHNPGFHGEATQAKAQVLVYSDAAGTTLTYDSTLVALTESEFDLENPPTGAASPPTIADGANRWWKVRIEDDSGRTSNYSELEKFTRQDHGNLTILNPVDGATVEDVSPVVLINFTGTTLEATAAYLEHYVGVPSEDTGYLTGWLELWRRPRTTSPDENFTIPKGYIGRTDRQYRLRVKAWDTYDREARPDDPIPVQEIAMFTFDTDNTVDGVDTIDVSQHSDGSPIVDVVVTTDDAPDYFSLVIDGDRKHAPRIDPADVVTGVGEYTILYAGAEPGVSTNYKVERVVITGGEAHHSFAGPTADYTSRPIGIWLFDPDDESVSVRLEGPDHGADFEWGEVANVFYPAGGRQPEPPVRLHQSTRGREGRVSGAVRDLGSVKARTFLRRLRKTWRLAREVRLVIGEVNIPVVIGEPRDSPLNEPTPGYQVDFAVYQTGDFER